jgi:hypothetical protein
MGSTMLNEKQESNQKWINSLLTQLDLVRKDDEGHEGLVDLKLYWDQLEQCHLPERIRNIVADVNGAAGYHVLELLDYLPPQKTVLHVAFSKNRYKHVMEIELSERGAAVVFYSLKKFHDAWERYFPNRARKSNRTTVLELDFHAAEVLDVNIESWFSYLLSGFEKNFKPNPKQPLSEGSELRMSAVAGKLSA